MDAKSRASDGEAKGNPGKEGKVSRDAGSIGDVKDERGRTRC